MQVECPRETTCLMVEMICLRRNPSPLVKTARARESINVNTFEKVCREFWKVKIMPREGKNPQGNKAGAIFKTPL